MSAPGAERCAICSKRFEQSRRGRPRLTCGHACRQVRYRRRRDGDVRRGLVKLYQADARVWLPTVPDESVDFVLSDFPYPFDRGHRWFREWFEETIPPNDYPAILRELFRVLARNSHACLFTDEKHLQLFKELGAAAGFKVKKTLVWDKCSPGLGVDERARHEFVVSLEKGRRRGNLTNFPTVLRAPRVARGYPTEKPVPGLLALLVEHWSDPGELVLDQFCGSGNVGAACRQLLRRALLCDVDASFASSRLRLAPVLPQVTEA